MHRNIIETILGAVVLVVAIGFLSWAYARSNLSNTDGYTLVAKFDRVDGLDVGADVRISGIRIGKVLRQELDPQTYRATVWFSVRDGVPIPADTSAAVASASLLGGKYLALVPGGEDRMLADGGEITLTQSAINIEDLIGRYVFGAQGGGGGSGGSTSGGGPGGTGPGAPAGGGGTPAGELPPGAGGQPR